VDEGAVNELRLVLPPASILSESEDIEIQTRAVLSLLYETGIPSKPFEKILVNPNTCPNCDRHIETSRSPYCCEECREKSALVRQFRAGVQQRTILDLDRQAALGQKLWYVLGGGYPGREALVPERVKLKVIEREGNKCQQCGAKATTIDHSGSG
jgi:hypothetical protein